MHIAVLLILVIVIFFGPRIWANRTMKYYSREIHSLPGTGSELARHLLTRFGLSDTRLEKSDYQENHYNPEEKVIRLAHNIYDGKSMTAIVVSAHEVGHVIQHNYGYRPFFLRLYLAGLVGHTEKIASMLLMTFPFVAILTRTPALGVLMFIAGIGSLLIPVIFHLLTLPVEWDASFQRALPILIAGKYIPESGIPVARRILRAAALTYVAASLASVFNFYRWIAILRR